MKEIGNCCRCNAPMTLPDELYHAAKRSPSITFYCAYGHPQIFSEGQSEETKLRLERDRLKQRLAQKDDEIRAANSRATTEAMRANMEAKKAAQIKRRAEAALCPCCNRHFSQLARHMKTKHPNIVQIQHKGAALSIPNTKASRDD